MGLLVFVRNKAERLGDESLTPSDPFLFFCPAVELLGQVIFTSTMAPRKTSLSTPVAVTEQNDRRCVCSSILKNRDRRLQDMLGTVLLVILILLLIGALPNWGYSSNWGYGPSGGLGLVLVIVLILLLMGRI